MSINAKRLIIIQQVSSIIRIMLDTFFSIYLFKVVGLEELIIYRMFYYFLIPIGFLLVYKFINTKNYLNIYRLSLVMFLIFLFIVTLYSNALPQYYILFAMLHALASTLLHAAYNYIVFEVTDEKSTIKYLSISQTVSILIGVITPLTLGFLITKGSYTIVYIVLLIIVFALFMWSLKLNINLKDEKEFSLQKFFNIFTNNKVLKSMYSISIISGFTLQGALSVMVMPVLIIIFFGSEFSLGILKSGFALAAALASYIFSRKLKEKNLKFANTINILALVITPLIFLVKLDLITIIIYFLCFEVFKNLDNTINNSYLYSVLKYTRLEEFKKAHLFIRETALSSGRILSYALTFFLIIIFKDDFNVYRIIAFVLIIPEIFNIYFCNVIEKFKNI